LIYIDNSLLYTLGSPFDCDNRSYLKIKIFAYELGKNITNLPKFYGFFVVIIVKNYAFWEGFPK